MSKALATKNVAAVLLGIGMILSAFAFATPANAQSTTDLQAQINALLAQIAALQGSSSSGSTSCTFTFTANLKMGSKGTEVMNLQKFLNKSSDTQVAATGAGSPGNETSTFGPATKAAVIKFQNKYAADILTPSGLSKGTGNWFAASRAKANALCSTGTPTTPTTPGTTPGSLSVTYGSQPANSLAPQNASRVPFTTFTLTNSSNAAVTVTGVTVQRTGLGVNSNFAGVILMDSNGSQIGLSKTLNSNNQAVIGDTFTLQAGQSMTLTVAGNMASPLSSNAGQVVGLQVVGINTTATVSGSLPISGAMHTINGTLSIGSVSTSTSSFDPGFAQTKNIGDTDVRFAGVRFTANSVEDLRLFSIRWRQTGSASSIDLANVMTVVNGTSYSTTVDASGRYYTTIFPGGILIPKGQSIDAYIKGDIAGSNAAGRTVIFGIDRNTDVYFVGQTYGYGISVPVSGASSPWYNGYTITVQPGSASTISRATEVGSQNIAVNVMGQPLGAFATDFMGEAVSVQQMTMTIATSTAMTGLITDITLVDSNGAVVAGPVDATWVSGVQTVVFSDTVTFPIGRKVYTLKGKIPSTAVTGANVQVTVNPTNWSNVVGQTSGSNITLGVSSFTLSQMTVQGAGLTISMSAQPASATIAANQSGYQFATVQLDASQSGEDVRVNSVKLRVNTVTGLTGCQLFDGATAVTTGGNVINSPVTGADNTFVFNNAVVVPKGTVKNLALKCNLSGASNGATYTWTLISTTQSSATGVTSGNSITPTNSVNNGGTMTVGTPTATFTVAPASPSYMLAAANTTGVVMGRVNVRAQNEAMTLNRLALTGGNNDAITQAYVYDGATQVGTITFVGATATSSLMTVALPADTDKVLEIRADLAPITTGNAPAVEGALVQLNPSAVEINSPSNGTITAAGSGTVAGVRIYKTFPTVSQDAIGTSGAADGKLLRFKVTADSKGSLGISQFTFRISTTSVKVSDIGLYVLDASNQPVSQSGATSGSGLVNALVQATSTNFVIQPATNAIQVPAGNTYTFELRASSVSPDTSTYSVTTRLVADTAASPSSGVTTMGAVSGRTIWSPNATGTTAMVGNNDWTNGYGVLGLSSDIIQNRTN